MSGSGRATGDEYRTLDGVAVAILVLLTAHALSAELSWLWQTLRLIVAIE